MRTRSSRTAPGSASLLVVALLATVLANLVNNLPATLLLVPLVAPLGVTAVLAALVGLGVGSGLTYTGLAGEPAVAAHPGPQRAAVHAHLPRARRPDHAAGGGGRHGRAVGVGPAGRLVPQRRRGLAHGVRAAVKAPEVRVPEAS